MLLFDGDGNPPSFQTFLTESNSIRMEHAEDSVLSDGYQGAISSINFLNGVKEMLDSDVSSSINVTVKWDGCVDPNTIITTHEYGDITISEAIDHINNGNTLCVMQWDFDTESRVFSPVTIGQKQQGSKPWVDVLCENDHTLRLTHDHEVYTTNKGWIQASQLEEGDDILSC